MPLNVFAAQGHCQRDLDISMKYVITMFDDVFILQTSVVAAQGPGEIDLCISMRYAFW